MERITIVITFDFLVIIKPLFKDIYVKLYLNFTEEMLGLFAL